MFDVFGIPQWMRVVVVGGGMETYKALGQDPHKAYCDAFEFMLYLRQKTCATDGASSR